MGEITVQAGDRSGAENGLGVVTGRERGKALPWQAKAAAARWGTLEDRFRSRVEKSSGCWVWTGQKDDDGYGRLEAYGLRHAQAHRVAWQIANGPIPPGLVVCHRCDNPACVRVDHLFLGTQRENVRDSLAKGRHGSLKQVGRKRGPYRKKAA